MRLAIVESSSQGGLLHYAVQLADGLAGRGHEVDLLVPAGNELEGRSGAANMRTVLTPQAPPEGGPLGDLRLLRRARIAVRLVRSWGRVNWELRRRRYDAVILTSDIDLWPMAVAVLAITLGRGRMRIAGICHSVRPLNRWAGEELYVDSPLLTRALRVLYPRMDVMFVHGERSRTEFRQTWPPTRLVDIPHGDERIFAGEDPLPPAEGESLLFFGEWRKVKGLPVLMEAFDELLKRRPGAQLTIAGTPCPVDLDPEEVRRWAAGHPGAVEIVDHYVPVEDVPRLFGAARAVVNPYLTGYQSGVVHLAMTMGRAVIASEVGDLTTAVLDGVTGLTVPPRDPRALADALERILADPELAERLGSEGRRRLMEDSSWEVVAERVERALDGS